MPQDLSAYLVRKGAWSGSQLRGEYGGRKGAEGNGGVLEVLSFCWL